MPEGPEIRREADRLGQVLIGCDITGVEFMHRHLRHFGAALSGLRIDSVTSRGKALLIAFETGPTIYAHNQLYGRWYVTKAGKLPRTNRTLRLALHTPMNSALLYSASQIEVLSDAEVMAQPYLARLGPDALDERVVWRDILERLQHRAFAGRRLGGLYLDQSFVAGIGNYLRTEILYTASLHPLDRPKDLTRAQLGALARATLDVTRRAYATGGVTNTPARVEHLKRQGLRRGQYRHLAFTRDGAPCYRCGASIDRFDVSGRRVYICAHCQPERRNARAA